MNNIFTELQSELATFPDREESLRAIKRYSLYPIFFYRSSLYSHSKRVAWLIATVGPVIRERLGEDFDFRHAMALALVHDDAEIITGDYQAATKQKMTQEQLKMLEQEEREALRTLAKRFPSTIGGFSYQGLLEEIIDLPTPEAQVAKFLDRFDAQGEAWHDLYAGNVTLTRAIVNDYGVNALPHEFYHAMLPSMLAKYPYMQRLAGTHPFFMVPELRDWQTIVQQHTPYTRASLDQPVGHGQYEAWRQVVLDSGDSEEIENLYTQREFL